MPDDPKKTFTFEEARKLLPLVRARTQQAVEAIKGLELSSDDDEERELQRNGLEDSARQVLVSWAQDMTTLGIEVKGPWLVDFDSGGGYYCWQWPEERLEYFHGYEEGIAGRVRLQ